MLLAIATVPFELPAPQLLMTPRNLKSSRLHSGRNCRKGLAVVELAVCLPVLVVILLATIETCVMLQLQQNLAITAYEGARIGIMPGSDASAVQLQCELLLDDRSIQGYTISMNPADPLSMEIGEDFTVTINADCAANSVLGGMFFQGKNMNESVVMRAE